MARTTGTTRAKTKTTKKKPAASVKAARASRATKSTNTAVIKEAKASSKINLTTAQRFGLTNLRNWHFTSAAVFVLLAVAAGVLMKETTYQVTLGHLTPDVLRSQTNTVFAPAQTVLADVDVRWLLVGMLGLSAVFSLLRATRFQALEAIGTVRRLSPVAWIDYAITFAIMAEVVALLSGMHDLVALKLIGGLTAVSFLLNWTAERENIAAVKPVKASYILSLVTVALPLLAIAAYAAATPVWGMIRAPWYVYALYAVLGLAFALGTMNQLNGLRRFKQWASYVFVERNSVWLNLLAKTAFAVVLIIGLYNN